MRLCDGCDLIARGVRPIGCGVHGWVVHSAVGLRPFLRILALGIGISVCDSGIGCALSMHIIIPAFSISSCAYMRN